MNEQKLTWALSSINVWWNGLDVPSRIKKSNNKRSVFYDLSEKCLEDNLICSIRGPRQVGKTTLMGQLIEYQIKEKKVDPKRIIYIPVDNELLRINSDNVLIDCLKIYFEYVIGEPPEALNSKVYIYLDEIQSLSGWANQVKSYYDTYGKIKFIVSGSSDTKLYNDASESLVGRIQFRIVLPFKFREFMEFDVGREKMSKALDFSTVSLREALQQSIKGGDPVHLYKKITGLQIQISSELPRIKKLIEQYMIKGGYPGLLEFREDYDKALERIKTDLELTVYKDIHKMFNTRNTSDIMTLLVLIASSSGQKINYSRLASSLGIDRRAVAEYIHYTKHLFLIAESPAYKNSKYKQIEKMDKAYILDVGHRNALLGKMNKGLLNDPEMGLVVQTAVFNHASRLKFYLSQHTEYEIFYWEDKDHEVDIVLDLPGGALPIEVKSKSGEKALGAIYRFMDVHNNSKWGIIVTTDELKIEKNILLMPLWAFLLMC